MNLGTSAGVLMLRPDWPAASHVGAACSTRGGGVSAPPYDSLNLGDHVGDAPENVAANRERWAAAIGGRPVFLKQVHGRGVVQLAGQTPDGTEADACWTAERGVACTIMVADCLPVLLTDRAGRAVGAAHCGWRGLAGEQGVGVLESLWEALWPQFGPTREAAAAETLAWLGPCIGPSAFEVGAEVRAAFVDVNPVAALFFREQDDGKFLADLPRLARERLLNLGIAAIHGNDGTAAWCTVTAASRFFSHRRDRVSGRFAASIWMA